jgi:uncharacterized membrane protein
MTTLDDKTLDNKTVTRVVALSAIAIVIMFIISIWAWMQLPAGEQIPIHWNAAGEADGYGSKFTGLMLLPLISIAIVGLFALIPRIEPRRLNLSLSRTAYLALWAILILYFLGLHIVLTLSVLGNDINVGQFVPALVGVLFIIIGNYMGKFRSNFMVGIRTPWTLTSDLAWDKTHRLGGKLFVLMGIVMVVAVVLLPTGWWVYIMLGTLLPLVVGLMAYSYFVWKNDPNRQSG